MFSGKYGKYGHLIQPLCSVSVQPEVLGYSQVIAILVLVVADGGGVIAVAKGVVALL